MRAKVIVVANRKGGEGKSTTAVNIAAEFGARGKRVLVVDLDTQGHAALGLGVVTTGRMLGAHAAFRQAGVDLSQAILRTSATGVDVLPAECDYHTPEARPEPLALVFALRPLAELYDDIIVDLSPTLDHVMIAALAACDRLLIPTQLHHLARDSVNKFARALFRVAAMTNRTFADFAVAPVQVDRRMVMQREIYADLVRQFGTRRVLSGIRMDVALAEAFGAGLPIRNYRPLSRGAVDYAGMAEEALAAWASSSSRLTA